MKTPVLLALLAASLFAPAAALAQNDEAPAPPPTAPAPAAPAPGAPPAAAPAEAPCRLGAHEGFSDQDANAAARLVCGAIANEGGAMGRHFRVELDRLGSSFFVSVVAEGATPGSIAAFRKVRLKNIEEVEAAAPGLAQAIVRGMAPSETGKVDDVGADEARTPKSSGGKAHFAAGLLASMPVPTMGVPPVGGLLLDVHYETESRRLELGGSLRFAAGVSNPTMYSFNASLGARYFTSDADVSPYIGGGASWMVLAVNTDTIDYPAATGFAVYGDAGVEILRTHDVHLAFGLRADVPFFALQPPPNTSMCTVNGCGPGPGSQYYLPVSLEARLTF